MNIACLCERFKPIVANSTEFQTWCSVTDSTAALENIFLFAVDEQYYDTVFPRILITNESQSNDYLNCEGFEFTTSIVLTFTASPNIYLDTNNKKIRKIGELLLEFQRNVDQIVYEIMSHPDIKDSPLRSTSLMAGPDIQSYQVENIKGESTLLRTAYIFEFFG
jgi:hypothetical protein